MEYFKNIRLLLKAAAFLFHLFLFGYILRMHEPPWDRVEIIQLGSLGLLTMITLFNLIKRANWLLFIPLFVLLTMLMTRFEPSVLAYLLFFHGIPIILDFPPIKAVSQVIPLLGLFILLAAPPLINILTLSSVLILGGSINYFLRKFIDEYEGLRTELERSRWSASELPQVLLRIGESVKKAGNKGRMNERIRVAREVHDTVGYTLTALISQIEVIGELMDEGPLKERVSRLEELTRKSLQNIRMEVDNLRDEEEIVRNINWEDRLRQLCDVFHECTGVRIDHRINNGDYPFSDEIGSHVSRILQETLTNAYRHGKASLIDVAISYKESLSLYLIRVSDNGKGQLYVIPGNGLTGIMERAGRLGGEVKYETVKGKGFDIGIDIPYNDSAKG